MNLTALSINSRAARVLVHGISNDPAFLLTHAPLHRVTRLTLIDVDTRLVAQFVCLTPNIVHLTVVPSIRHAVVPSFTATQIIMPHLVHLSLVPSKHDRFYGAIVAPQLSSLTLDVGPFEMRLLPYRKHIAIVTYLSVTGPIHLLDLTFRNILNTDSVTVLRLDLLPVASGHDLPLQILSLMDDYSTVLPNVRDLHTNAVWTRSALELLRTLRQPRVTLSIFIVSLFEDQPFPGAERIKYLCDERIVRVIRQFHYPY